MPFRVPTTYGMRGVPCRTGRYGVSANLIPPTNDLQAADFRVALQSLVH